MALEIKYSEKLANSALNTTHTVLKCTWADLEVLVLNKHTSGAAQYGDIFRKILLAVVTDIPQTANPNIVDKLGLNTVFQVGYMPLRWRQDFFKAEKKPNGEIIYGPTQKTIGLPTGNYIDYLGERYIEISIIPPAELLGICKSKQWIGECLKKMSLSAENEYRKYLPYREILQQMYNGVGYKKMKYVLTYTIPEKAWVKLKSVTLYNLDDTVFDKGDIEKDSSDLVEKPKKDYSKLLLLASLFLLGD